MDGADCSTFAAVQRGMSGAGRRASANPSNAGGFWGVECARRVRAGDYPPEHSRGGQGRFSRGSRGAGSPPSASAWPAPRCPDSARARIPECPGKGRGKTIAPSATEKAFFRPPVRIRRVRANATRNARCAGALPAPVVGSGEHSPIPPASPPTFPARWPRPRPASAQEQGAPPFSPGRKQCA